jgi:hypothetical protein
MCPSNKRNGAKLQRVPVQDNASYIFRRTVNLRPTVAAGRAAANVSRAMHLSV